MLLLNKCFFKLRDKAETQKRIIDSITARINAASTKATQLKKTTKATVVVSPSSYPFSQPTHYQNLFTPLPSKPDLCHLQTPQKPKLGPVLRPSNQEVDLSFSIMEQFPRKSQTKKVSHPVVSSVDELVPFGQEKSKVKKSKKPKRKEDIDPLVWDDLMSSLCREPQDRYVPGFQNFPENPHLPEHLMSSNVATNITYEKISKDTIAPTLLWDLPPVGVNPITSSETPKTPQIPEPAIPTSDKKIGSNEPVTRPSQPKKTEDTRPEERPTIPLPPPPPPVVRPDPPPSVLLPTRRRHPQENIHTELLRQIRELRSDIEEDPTVPKKDNDSEGMPPGVSNIPLPPPPPPVVRPVPPAVPIPTRRRNEPQAEDIHTELFRKIRELRSDIEEDPTAPKKDNDNDEWE